MKQNILRVMVTALVGIGLMAAPISSFAGSAGLASETLTAESILVIDAHTALIQNTDRVTLLDTEQEKTQTLIENSKILDVHVLTQPSKIVVLTATKSGKIEKQVFNRNGNITSRTVYNIPFAPPQTVKWIAPSAKAQERLMIQKKDLFTLYDSAGKKILRYNAQLKQDFYEHILVDDWDFSAYPYLVVQYTGERTMTEDYFVRIVNLYTHSVTELPGLQSDKQFRIDSQGRLNVWDSYQAEEVTPANSVHPNLAEEQTFHALYNLSTGKALIEHKSKFTAKNPKNTGGWKTQTAGDFIFVRDAAAEEWSLYLSREVQPIAANQKDLQPNARFVGYSPDTKTAYFLEKEKPADQVSLRKIKIK